VVQTTHEVWEEEARSNVPIVLVRTLRLAATGYVAGFAIHHDGCNKHHDGCNKQVFPSLARKNGRNRFCNGLNDSVTVLPLSNSCEQCAIIMLLRLTPSAESASLQLCS
jgi:hypothetical protein